MNWSQWISYSTCTPLIIYVKEQSKVYVNKTNVIFQHDLQETSVIQEDHAAT